MKGKWLEQLVGEIEANLLPEGFSVTSNERVFNESGVPLAEFDILISGKLGSTNIKWLIECRDRPSDGPAPGSWIEQLVGRRDRFKFNKVTAVSTTGFAEGVIDYAKEKDIELRAVEKITFETIKNWCQISLIKFIFSIGYLIHGTLVADDATEPYALQGLNDVVSISSVKDPIFKHTGTHKSANVLDAWRNIIHKNPHLFDGLEPNGEGRNIKLKVSYVNPYDRFKVSTKNGDVDIVQIYFEGEINVVEKEATISQITQYTRLLEQNNIAQSVQFEEIQAGDTIFGVSLHNFGEQEKAIFTVRTTNA